MRQVFNLRLCRCYFQQGHPVEAESVGALNSHIHKLPYEFLAFASLRLLSPRRKYNNFIRAGSPHQARAVCFAGPFAKHFHLASHQAFKNPAIRFVYYLQQILIALFFQMFVDLIWRFPRQEYRAAAANNETRKRYRTRFPRPNRASVGSRRSSRRETRQLYQW